MDENSKIIAGLKSTIGKLTMKNNKYKEENSNIAMQYKVLKQKYLNMVFSICLHFTLYMYVL